MLKSEFGMIANYFGNSISQVINSHDFLNEMSIRKLEDLDVRSPEAQQWLLDLRELENTDFSYFIGDRKAPGNEGPKIIIHKPGEGQNEDMVLPFIEYFRLRDLIKTTIVFEDQEVYPLLLPQQAIKEPDLELWKIPEELTPMMKKLRMYFDIKYQFNLLDSRGKTIGNVIVQVNPSVTVPIFLASVAMILLAGLLSLILANLISRPLANHIINPIQQMERTFRSAAEGNYGNAMERPIQIRRPLREIESMVFSTNIIIDKLKRYNEDQEQQKVLLQQQNVELEAQNQELAESKLQIERAQSQLIQMENLAQVGQLTAAISHEINTPLGVINSNVQLSTMLSESLEQLSAGIENEEVRDMVEQISEAGKTSAIACRRIDEIIKNLRVFSKIDQSSFQEADINAGVRSTVVLTTNLWKKHIHIVEEYGEIPSVKCFAGLINQVFMNIMTNAIQSIENAGEIHIRTFQDGENVHISFKDTGNGISPENLERIFDFGFSTKGDKGMGIGLSMCQDIIRKHKGQILVQSELGKGTEFTVVQPLKNE
jgi:signal transduction histidine kinase